MMVSFEMLISGNITFSLHVARIMTHENLSQKEEMR